MSTPRWAIPAIALVSIAAYLNTLPGPPVWDDAELLTEQPLVSEPAKIVEIFSSPYWGPDDYLYRPLTVWTLALGHGVAELVGAGARTPFVHHLVNVVLHAGVGLALFSLLRAFSLGAWPGLVAAMFFVLHPLRTEVVAQIVGRGELLAALFGLLFLRLHVSGGARVAGAACLLAALCSKESAIAFVPLAVWTDFVLRRSDRPFRPTAYVTYLLVVLLWVAIRAVSLDPTRAGIPYLDNPAAYAPVAMRVLTAARVQFDYLLLQLWPVGLSADYSHAQIPLVESLLDPRVVGFGAILAAAGAAAWRLRQRPRVVSYGVVGYAILAIGTANVLFPIGTIMGERLTYAPSLLVAAMVGYLAWLARERFGPAVTVATALLLVSLFGLTWARNRSWADPTKFAQTLVRSSPGSAKAYYTLGIDLQETDSLPEAQEQFERAIEIYPSYAEAWSRLGQIHSDRADFPAAARVYAEATRIHAGFTEAWYGLGHAYQRMGRLEEAEQAYLAALRLESDLVPAYANLGAVYAGLGRLDEAERMWLAALERDPDHAAARENLEQLRGLRER